MKRIHKQLCKVGGLAACLAAGGVGAQSQPTDRASPAVDQAAKTVRQVNLGTLKIEGAAPSPDGAPMAIATVTRQQMQNLPPTEPADILASIPGVFSRYDGGPGLAIAVRGMQDFGRINVSIDGARQDFQTSSHSANGTVYIDPALLAGIDVARGTVSTAQGAGVIGGVVNLRTIDIDDVLAPNWRYGVTTTDMAGTNGYDNEAHCGLTPCKDDLVAEHCYRYGMTACTSPMGILQPKE